MDYFNFWKCHKVLPLAYDNSLSYYEFLCKVLEKLNLTIDEMNKIMDLFAEFEKNIDPKIHAEVEKVVNEFMSSYDFQSLVKDLIYYTEPDNFSGYTETGVKECFDFANTNNIPVIFKPNKAVEFETGGITIMVNTDFNGCTIVKKTDNALFNVLPSDNTDGLELASENENTSPIFGKYATSVTGLFGKFFIVETPNMVSSTTHVTHAFLANKNGHYTNGVRHDEPTNGTYRVYRYRTPDLPICIKNAVLKNVGYKQTEFFNCRRDNVTFDSFKIIGGVEQTGNWSGQFFVSRYNINNVYKNIVCYESLAVSPSGGYIISGDTCANLSIENCNFTGENNSWGQITFTFVSGLTIRDSIFNRLDWHYGCENGCTISNCHMDYVSYGGCNYDSILFENCVFNTSLTNSCVSTRNNSDVQTFIDGFMKFSNCSFNREKSGLIFSITKTNNVSDYMNCKNGNIIFDSCLFDPANYVDVMTVNGNNKDITLNITFKNINNESTFSGYYWLNNDSKINTLTFDSVNGITKTYFNANIVKFINCIQPDGEVMGIDLKASQSGVADTIFFDRCVMGRVTNPVPCKNLIWTDCIITVNYKQLIRDDCKGGIMNCFIRQDIEADNETRMAWYETINN